MSEDVSNLVGVQINDYYAKEIEQAKRDYDERVINLNHQLASTQEDLLDAVSFVHRMLVLEGIPEEKINETEYTFVWMAANVNILLNRGAAYGDAWAWVTSKLAEKLQATP